MSDALEALYDAFAAYPRPPRVHGCPCCVSEDDQAQLFAASLRTLTAEQLRRYSGKALTTWGTADDLRHFLPRLLELATARPPGGEAPLDLSLVMGKLAYGAWTSWPAPERAAVDAYVRACWAVELSTLPARWPSAGQFLADVTAAIDVEPLVATWEGDRRCPAMLQLAELVLSVWPALARHGDLRRWGAPPGRDVVARWLLHPERARSLEAAFLADVDAPDAGRFAEAADAYQWVATEP